MPLGCRIALLMNAAAILNVVTKQKLEPPPGCGHAVDGHRRVVERGCWKDEVHVTRLRFASRCENTLPWLHAGGIDKGGLTRGHISFPFAVSFVWMLHSHSVLDASNVQTRHVVQSLLPSVFAHLLDLSLPRAEIHVSGC